MNPPKDIIVRCPICERRHVASYVGVCAALAQLRTKR